jgi:hypothetical protein
LYNQLRVALPISFLLVFLTFLQSLSFSLKVLYFHFLCILHMGRANSKSFCSFSFIMISESCNTLTSWLLLQLFLT